MTKTATAIVVALLWSTTITSLMNCIFAAYLTEYEQRSYWLGLFVISILVLGIIPVIAFKYEKPNDFWAVLLLIEILGHLWGFKVKDIVTYGAYKLHYLYGEFSNFSDAPEYSYCNLVNPELATPGTFEAPVTAFEEGFLGFNLEWSSYVHNVSVFAEYFEQLASWSATSNSSTTSPEPHRRGLASLPTAPAPAPYMGPHNDLVAPDSHEIGPGKVCAFEYKTILTVGGYRVEKQPRIEYLFELGSVRGDCVFLTTSQRI